MGLPMISMQTSLQVGSPFGSYGPQPADFMSTFRRHHHHHHDYDNSPFGQQNGQLGQIGRSLMEAGQQLVEEGQQLIQQGDVQQGLQLVREGARLEQQGARLESQGANGAGPYGQDGGSCGQDNGSYPANGQCGPQQSRYSPSGCGDNGYGQNCDGGQMSVDGNTVDTGRYLIKASKDHSGTLEVTDKETGKSFKVWGDPHIQTDQGGKADFQHAPATFELPDGTKITVTPTDNPGVNTIDHVTITKGNDAVTMNGFTSGQLQTQHLQGQGRYLDASTQDGTVMHADCGQIDDLVLPDGTEIAKNDVGNIDKYANDDSQMYAQLQQTIAQLQQQISQIEQSLQRTGLMTTGFACNPLQGAMYG